MRLNPVGKKPIYVYLIYVAFVHFGGAFMSSRVSRLMSSWRTRIFYFILNKSSVFGNVGISTMWACEMLQEVVSSHPSRTGRSYLAMAMALNCLLPSDTAFATAFLSAQIPRLLHAFSMLQPVEDSGDFRDIWLCHKPLNCFREHFFSSRGAVWPLHHGQSVSSKTIFHVWFITESCHVFVI